MNRNHQALPQIPDKLYFTIGETSGLCGVKPHVLRYWEQEFVQLSPSKRRGGRRYYQQKDVAMIRRIRELLYSKGFTIAGAKQQIQTDKAAIDPLVGVVKEVVASVPIVNKVIPEKKDFVSTMSSTRIPNSEKVVVRLIADLQDLLAKLK